MCENKYVADKVELSVSLMVLPHLTTSSDQVLYTTIETRR